MTGTITVAAGSPTSAGRRPPVELALRRNPNRAQLLVSRLLGKHIPVAVVDVLAAGHALGRLAARACADPPVVVGFAETATALGHAVATAAGSDGCTPYLHTTRRPAPPGATVIEFAEEHSHAVEQTLVVLDDTALAGGAPLILVDDEISTGRTAVNAIRAVHGRWPRRHYVLASLLDSRTAAHVVAGVAAVAELGATLCSVTLAVGDLAVSGDVLDRAAALRHILLAPAPAVGLPAPVTAHVLELPAGVPTTAAHGWGPAAEAGAQIAARVAVAGLGVCGGADTLVLGDEEHMYLPQLLAAALGPETRTSTTTRSPAIALDVVGYPLRTALTFRATDGDDRPAFAYNVAASRHIADPGNAPGFRTIVFVTDTDQATVHPTGVLGPLARTAGADLHVVTVRAGAAPTPVLCGGDRDGATPC